MKLLPIKPQPPVTSMVTARDYSEPGGGRHDR